MNILIALGIIAFIWFTSKRTKWRFFAAIIVGVIFMLFSGNTTYPGDTVCYGIALIVGGAFWFLVHNVMTNTKKN